MWNNIYIMFIYLNGLQQFVLKDRLYTSEFYLFFFVDEKGNYSIVNWHERRTRSRLSSVLWTQRGAPLPCCCFIFGAAAEFITSCPSLFADTFWRGRHLFTQTIWITTVIQTSIKVVGRRQVPSGMYLPDSKVSASVRSYFANLAEACYFFLLRANLSLDSWWTLCRWKLYFEFPEVSCGEIVRYRLWFSDINNRQA